MGLYEDLRRLKLAIVEDDTLLRESLVLYFRLNRCDVAAFAEADAALEEFGKNPPDIVVSDLRLPGVDGMTLLRQVGERRPGTLRILVTAHASAGVTREVEQAGIDGFLLKPFSVPELEDALRRLLEGRRDRTPGRSGTA